MYNDPRGPIEHFSWGRFVICGQEHSRSEDGERGCGKDIRLIGHEVSEWRERKGHELKPSMITGVYDQHIEVLIVGVGVDGMLHCPSEVRKAISEHGVNELVLARTPEACQLYNRLFHEGKRVALLAHGTC
jgi:hypothetical protein